MKLHLPKSLLVAVLAACVAPAAWGASDNTNNSGWDKIKDGYGTTVSDSYGIGDETISSIDTSDGDSSKTTLIIRSNNGINSAEVTTFTIAESDTAKIQGWWESSNDHPQFELLTINTLNFGNSSTLEVAAGNTVKVDAYTGTFKGTIDGTLTIEGVANLTNASISTSSNNTGAGSLIITGNPESNRDTGASVIGGTATISCTSSEIRGTLGIRGNGTLKYTGGTHSVTKLDIHNDNAYDGTDELIVSGATVNVTGTDDSNNMNNDTSGPAAVLVGHWNKGTGKISVGGESAGKSVFNVFEGTIRMSYNASSNLTIGKNGIVNAMGIQYSNFHDGTGTDSAVINLCGGRLNLGSGGISANTSKTNVTLARELNLQSGTLGALASSVNIGAGDVNLSGAVTIDTAILGGDGVATGGEATITFSQALNAQEGASLTIQGGGAVNLSSINMSHTLDLSILDDTNLTIGAVVLDPDTIALSAQEGATATQYYSMDGGATQNTDGNGFLHTSGDYVLFNGYVWNGSLDNGLTVSSDGTNTYVTANTVGTIYYVNEGEHTISAAGNYINGRATRYIVEQGATLVIDSAQETIVDGNESVVLSAAQLLTGAIGEGNVVLSTSVSLSNGESTQTTGKLTINNGATLTLGSHKTHLVDISDYSSLVLDNGTLELKTATSSFNDVTVTENSGTIKVQDMPDNFESNPHQLTGTTTVTKGGTLSIETSQWRQHLNLHHLTGEGNVAVKDTSQGTSKTDSTIIDIASLQGYSGVISLEKNGDAAPMTLTATTGGIVTLSGLTLGADTAAEFINGIKDNVSPGGTLGLGTVKMSGGSQLTLTNGAAERTTNITSLEVTGSATIGTKRHGDCWQGTINIGSLTNTGDSAVLTLMNGSQCDATTTINLNGGSLKGTINVESNAVAGANQNRKLQVNINASDLAKDAVINFCEPSTGNTSGDTDLLANNKQGNYNILGVGADTVKVGGLTGTTTKAATIKSTGNSGIRTLEINTTQGADYSTNAKVEASVNLVKSGEGTQTFTSDTSDSIASTSIAVNGGVLALTGLAELHLQDLVVKSGATLSVGNVVATVDEGSSNQTTPSTSVSKTATLHGGATINSSLNLSNASSLTLNGIGENSLVMINGDLILPVASETPTLTLSGDILSSLNAMNQGDELGIFSVQGGFFVGDQVTDALDATNGIALSTVFSASEDNNFEGYYLGFIPDEAGYSTVYIGKIVPEPTTATLSLLALAALAARRRRR